jgi:Domain of unknown function (DUF4832)/Domain of unknown function (DUF4874)
MVLIGELIAAAALAACGGGGDADTTTVDTSPAATEAATRNATTQSASESTQSVQANSPVAAPAAAPLGVVTFAPTTADFPNPDRGFYGWAGSDFVSNFDLGSVQGAYSNGLRLVHGSVSLAAYRNADLPASFLTTLGNRLASVRSAGMKVTLLFAYDFSGSGNDATADRIKRHLEQLKPVLAANADVVPYMRAGFIGAWGEWHSSKSGNSCGYNSDGTPCDIANANRTIVRDALLANAPTTTQIGFRYPADLQRWYPNADGPARVASHNDCFLAGPSDSGTFTESGQRSYLQNLTKRVAFGGETCDNAETPVRDTCADILSEGAQYHLAWLNSTYAASVLNAWRAGGCYAKVSSTMGYRIQLDSISHNSSVARGNSLAVAVDLRNVGWAKMFGARKLVVTLRNRTTGAKIAASGGSLKSLPAQANSSSRITVSVNVPTGAAAGTYDVLLSAPDSFAATKSDVRFAVRFANADQANAGQTWNASAATLSTGTSVKVN